MKKLHYFFSFILLSLVGIGSASAQYFSLGKDMVTEIKNGETYGLRSATSFNEVRLLNGYAIVDKFTDDCLFVFEDTGRKADGNTVWRLKQKTTGKYIKHQELSGWLDSSDTPPAGAVNGQYIIYTDDIKEAFGFTILPVDTTAATGTYRTSASTTGGAGAQDISEGYVLCSEKTHFDEDGKTIIPTYLGYYGNAFLSPWEDTNVWRIYTLAPAEGKELVRLAMLDKGDIAPEVMESSIGTTPGCISQEAWERYEAAYYAADDVVYGGVAADNDRCKAITDELIAAREEMDNSVVPVVPGSYYIIQNKASNTYMYDNGTQLAHNAELTSETNPVLEDAKYIFCLEATDSLPYLKNFGTDQYVGGGSPYSTVDDTLQHTITHKGVTGDYFYIWNEDNGAGGSRFCRDAGSGLVTSWGGDDENGQRLWKFIPVDEALVNGMKEAVAQNRLNKELEALYTQAYLSYGSGRKFISKDMTLDGDFSLPGIVTSADQISSNSIAGSDGPANLLDGDLSTIYHSAWQDGIPQEASYLQFTLDEAQKTLALKVAKRMTKLWASNPTAFKVEASKDGEKWYNEGACRFTYDYTTEWMNGEELEAVEKSSAIFGFEMSEAYRFVRLSIEDVLGSPELKNGHPLFYASELRVYPGEYDPANSVYEQVPVDVRNAFKSALDVAGAQVKSQKATREAIDNLRKAYDAFRPLLPVADDLYKDIQDAKTYEGNILIGTEVGMYPEAAKAVLDTAIVRIERSIDPLWTVDQINAAREEMAAAFDAFKAAVNMPLPGKIYVIRSVSKKRPEANDQYVYAGDFGDAAPLKYGGYYPDSTANVNVTENAEYLWYFRTSDDGDSLVLTNISAGLPVSPAGKLSKAYQTVKVVKSEAPLNGMHDEKGKLAFVLKLDSALCLNVNAGGNVVSYADANDANSAFVFEEAQFNGIVKRPVLFEKTQVLCYPFEFRNMFSGGYAYEVAGEKDGKMMLKEITSNTIAAGTPFVYIPALGYAVETEALELTSGANKIPSYKVWAETVNGLRGTVFGHNIPEGCGYINEEGKIAVSPSTRVQVPACSGYFIGGVTTTETTEHFLEIAGEITSIGSVVAEGDAAEVSVYTLDGVCIRKNVSAAAATNGLPAGLYIVGSKVVLVK